MNRTSSKLLSRQTLPQRLLLLVLLTLAGLVSTSGPRPFETASQAGRLDSFRTDGAPILSREVQGIRPASQAGSEGEDKPHGGDAAHPPVHFSPGLSTAAHTLPYAGLDTPSLLPAAVRPQVPRAPPFPS